MAGIGFELRRLLAADTLLAVFRAYGYAGVVGSGPWVLSILGLLSIGLLSPAATAAVAQFQTSVTYLIAASLVFTGGPQLAFTRFVSDRLFEGRDELVADNLNGLLMAVLLAAGGIGSLAMFFLFPGQSLLYRLLMLAAFALLCAIWIVAIFLSGLRHYRAIVLLFALGYAVTVAAALGLRPFGLEGLLAGFVLGHGVLLAGMWLVTLRHFRPQRLTGFEFARPDLIHPSLLGIGLLYNLGVWADKFMFWFFPATSRPVVGLLRTSVIYDLPVFLAYLAVIPGMAVFMVRIETDFVDYYERFYDAVRGGGSLELIEDMRNQMVLAVRRGLGEIAKIQGLASLAAFVAAPSLLATLDIPALYLPLLYVQVVGAGLQVMLLAALNVLFYLDRRRIILFVCAEFVVLNLLLTAFTLRLGAPLYGYGFTVAVLLTLTTAVALLDRKLGRLEYETFMLR